MAAVSPLELATSTPGYGTPFVALLVAGASALTLLESARGGARMGLVRLVAPLGLLLFAVSWFAAHVGLTTTGELPLGAGLLPAFSVFFASVGAALDAARDAAPGPLRDRWLPAMAVVGGAATLALQLLEPTRSFGLRAGGLFAVAALLLLHREGARSGEERRREESRSRFFAVVGVVGAGAGLFGMTLLRGTPPADPLLLGVLGVQADLLARALHQKARAWLSRAVAYAGLTVAATFACGALLRLAGFELDLLQAAFSVLLASAVGVVLLVVGERAGDGLERLFLPEQAQAERELARARAESAALRIRLERAERLAVAGELASRVAHEIKNPLAAVRGWAELLSADDGSEAMRPRRDKALAFIRSESDRIDAAVAGLLQQARPTQAPAPGLPVELRALVIEGLALVEPERRGTALRLLPGGEGLLVHAEADALRGALHNLLRNALQACDGQGAVEARLSAEAGRVRLELRDEGGGIPPELLARLFQPFVTGRPLGTGLGLAIARSAVESCGGSLTLTNRDDRRGAVATLSLPGVEGAGT